MSDKKWHVMISGAKHGPFSNDEIKAFLNDKKIDGNSDIKHNDMDYWCKVHEFGIFGVQKPLDEPKSRMKFKDIPFASKAAASLLLFAIILIVYTSSINKLLVIHGLPPIISYSHGLSLIFSALSLYYVRNAKNALSYLPIYLLFYTAYSYLPRGIILIIFNIFNNDVQSSAFMLIEGLFAASLWVCPVIIAAYLIKWHVNHILGKELKYYHYSLAAGLLIAMYISNVSYNKLRMSIDFVVGRGLIEKAIESKDITACNKLNDIYYLGRGNVTDLEHENYQYTFKETSFELCKKSLRAVEKQDFKLCDSNMDGMSKHIQYQTNEIDFQNNRHTIDNENVQAWECLRIYLHYFPDEQQNISDYIQVIGPNYDYNCIDRYSSCQRY